MFTRMVEMNVKPGKTDELTNMTRTEILPMLKMQKGFTDLIILVDETTPNHVLALSFWKTKEEAQTYHNETFNKIKEKMQPYLQTTPNVRYFNLETSTVHKIAAGLAA